MVPLDRIAPLLILLCCLLVIGVSGQSEETCLPVARGAFKNWEADKLQIRRIAGCLKRHPFTVGFFGYYSDDKFSEKKAARKVEEAIADLKLRFPVESNRLFVKYLGVSSNADFYSQVLLDNFPPPWERPAKLVGSPVELTLTRGWHKGQTYTESERFVLSFPDDTLIADVITTIRGQMQIHKMQLHHPPYLILVYPESWKIVDPRKSLRELNLTNGSVLWISSRVR